MSEPLSNQLVVLADLGKRVFLPGDLATFPNRPLGDSPITDPPNK
ncbi:MAG: hypothetical protein Q4C71_01690 [Microbacteriaceae bacterium]|nr:hypothetical protein [Microbacteriaceae bacterium]